jgi:Protein of unknown function (DUF2778)
MAWTYHQRAGSIYSKNAAQPTGQGYSGFETGRNNPALGWMHDVGPIPAGAWKIIKPAYDDPHLGPIVMKLEPVGHDAHGRTDFRIHGDNITSNASHGCIILAHGTRQIIAASDDCDLMVVE